MGIPAYRGRTISSSTHNYTGNTIPTDHISDESSTKESEAIVARPVAPSKAVSRSEATAAQSSITNTAYSSDLLQLQIDELLLKVRPDYERRMLEAENALRKLKHIIERIPNREAKPILEAEREQQQSHTVEIPFPKSLPAKDARYTLAYSRPANINVVGSYARKTAIQVGDQLVIDLAVSMPSHIFQEKDYLNYRYFNKRAFYLACIATGIEEAEDCSFAIEFAFKNDNELLPVILVSPGQGSDDFTKSRCQIRIILAADGDLFPIAKTLPNKNCIRPKAGATALQSIANTATPFYNASLRSECSTLAYLNCLHKASTQSTSFADACALGSVWLRQRGLGRGGFGPFEWACTMVLLMQGVGPKRRPVLSKGYSSYQLFKATLQYLAMTDLVANPAFFQSVSTDIVNLDNPVLFDGANGLNVLFQMTPWSYANLRHEASGTLKFLSDPVSEHFDACFITRINEPLQRFDCVFNIPVLAPHTTSPQESDAISDDVTYCRHLYEALKSGLGDRVAMIYLEMPVKLPWFSGVLRSAQTNQDHIQVGLLLNPEQTNRTVDRGPFAQDKEAATAFRTFWGKKAELRRFKDGSIQESLVWSGSDHQNSVLKQIVTYVVQRNVGEEAAAGLELVGDSFNRLLPSHDRVPSDPFANFQPIMSAFEVLQKDLRDLEGLPLHIRQISPADPQLRYASFAAPILDSVQCKMDAANICIQFEGSSRWPDDLTAVQRIKIAFLLKIGDLLEESVKGLNVRVGLENTDSRLLNSSFLDILYLSGAFFRIRIHHEREPNLLDRILKGEAHTAASREEVASALSVYKRYFIQAPLHTQDVRTLSTRFPLLSPSMRLVKKWRDSHLLSGHISDELIELLTIHAFVHPHPWPVPGSVMTSFLRILTFISKWDWRSEPLIVDFNGEMNAQDIDNISLRFGAWRRADPAMNRMAMFAASNVDRNGTTWTEAGPSKVVAGRFKDLAKAACALVKEQGMNLELEALFAHSWKDYNFVIHLARKFVGNKQTQVEAFEGKRLVGFNPVRSFIEELRNIYGSNVLFFHDERAGSVIAGVWNPETGPRPWNVNLSYNTMPVQQTKDTDGEPQVTINKNAVLHEIARLGDDIISQIETK